MLNSDYWQAPRPDLGGSYPGPSVPSLIALGKLFSTCIASSVKWAIPHFLEVWWEVNEVTCRGLRTMPGASDTFIRSGCCFLYGVLLTPQR